MIDLRVLGTAFVDAVKTVLTEIRHMSTRTYAVLIIIAILIILVPAVIK